MRLQRKLPPRGFMCGERASCSNIPGWSAQGKSWMLRRKPWLVILLFSSATTVTDKYLVVGKSCTCTFVFIVKTHNFLSCSFVVWDNCILFLAIQYRRSVIYLWYGTKRKTPRFCSECAVLCRRFNCSLQLAGIFPKDVLWHVTGFSGIPWKNAT